MHYNASNQIHYKIIGKKLFSRFRFVRLIINIIAFAVTKNCTMSLTDAFVKLNISSSFDEEDIEKDILIAKAITMIVLCIVSTIMGIVPMFLAKLLKWDMSSQNSR